MLPVRPAKDGDWALIGNSWTMSYEGAPAVNGAERAHYREEMLRVIGKIRRTATVRVMHDPDDEDNIVGWVAFTGGEFHYGYVKETFRDACSLADLLGDTKLDAYTFRGRHIEHALVGVQGCEFRVDEKTDRHKWVPPKGWRFTPRFTI